MATFTSTLAVGERETLADVIYRIDPSETPIFSALKKETSNGIFTEWQVQELAAAATNNHANEGADSSFDTPTSTVRFGNYHQISTKSVAVSKTLDAIETAGRDKELAYQKVLKSLELRRDIEKSIGDTDVARSGSDPRKSASLSCWITNGSVGATAGAFGTGDGTDTITGGDDRALSLALIDDGMSDAWTDGGNPSLMVMSATNRANFSNLTVSNNLVQNQVNMTAAKETTYVGSTSIYLTDFGSLEATPSRFIGNDRVFLIDPDFASLCTINGRNFSENEIASTGDNSKFQLVTEWALKVQAPKAHSGIFDLNGS